MLTHTRCAQVVLQVRLTWCYTPRTVHRLHCRSLIRSIWAADTLSEWRGKGMEVGRREVCRHRTSQHTAQEVVRLDSSSWVVAQIAHYMISLHRGPCMIVHRLSHAAPVQCSDVGISHTGQQGFYKTAALDIQAAVGVVSRVQLWWQCCLVCSCVILFCCAPLALQETAVPAAPLNVLTAGCLRQLKQTWRQ